GNRFDLVGLPAVRHRRVQESHHHRRDAGELRLSTAHRGDQAAHLRSQRGKALRGQSEAEALQRPRERAPSSAGRAGWRARRPQPSNLRRADAAGVPAHIRTERRARLNGGRTGGHAPSRVLAAVVLLVLGGRASAGPCAGRFIAHGGVTLLGNPGIALGDATVTIGQTCDPAPTRVVRAGRKGWHVTARWTACDTERRIRLRARLSADCTLFAGVVRGKGLGQTHFSASRSRCGDGLIDAGNGEGCDDGNTLGGDLCEANCVPCDPSPGPFADTWTGVQVNVFERDGCVLCHGINALSGGLDLRPAVALTDLVGVPSNAASDVLRVQPGDEHASMLWLKLAKATLGGLDDLPGSAMPVGGQIPRGDLDAVSAWIRAGAPAAGAVPGSEVLLERCRLR